MKRILEIKTISEEETEKTAYEFSESLKSGDFVAFFGNLGSGKTAFIRGIAKRLCEGERVYSPTYAIVNEYKGKPDLFHFDLYRITDDDSLYATGFYDYFDRNGVICAEWCENIPFALPEERYEVRFEKGSDNERIITIDLYD